MNADGDWLLPHLNGAPFATKPPLGYWLMAGTFHLLREASPFTARLPSALAAFALVALLLFAGGRLFGVLPAALAAAVVVASPLWSWYARHAGIDMPLALLSFASFLLFLHGGKAWVAGAAVLGLGILVKAPAAWVVGIPLIALAGLRASPVRWRPARVLAAVALAALPVTLWLAALHLARGTDVFSIASAEAAQNSFDVPAFNRKPFYYYLSTVAAFCPLALILPADFMAFLRRWRSGDRSPRELGVWLYALGNLVFFSLFFKKKDYYLLPVLPAFALLIGLGLQRRWSAGWMNGWERWSVRLLTGVLLVAAAAAPIYMVVFHPEIVVRTSVTMTLAALVATIGLASSFDNEARRPALALLVCVALFLACLHFTFVPTLDAYRSRREFFAHIRPVVDGKNLIAYRYPSYDALFYLERTIPDVSDAGLALLEEVAASPEPTYVLSQRRTNEARDFHGLRIVTSRVYGFSSSFSPGKEVLLLANDAADASPMENFRNR